MSTNQFIIKIDDTAVKDLEQRLNGMFKNNSNGGNKSNSSQNPMQNLLKLGAIAIGVGTITDIIKNVAGFIVDVSPMLKSVLQLFSTTVGLILRPIGDFFGFILRPIMMLFLSYAIPYYKLAYPFLQKYGAIIGQVLANFIGGALGAISGAAGAAGAAASGVGKFVFDVSVVGSDLADKIFSKILPSGVGAAAAGFNAAWKSLTDFFASVNTSLGGLVDAWAKIMAFFSGLGAGFTSLTSAWDRLYGFFNSTIGGTIHAIESVWDKVYGFFNGSIGGVINAIGNAWDKFYAFFSGLGAAFSILTSGWDKLYSFFNTLSADVNAVLAPIWTAWKQFWVDVQAWIKTIQDWLKDPLGMAAKAIDNAIKPTTNQVQSGLAQAGTNIENLTITGLQVGGADLAALLKDPAKYITQIIQSNTNKGGARN